MCASNLDFHAGYIVGFLWTSVFPRSGWTKRGRNANSIMMPPMLPCSCQILRQHRILFIFCRQSQKVNFTLLCLKASLTCAEGFLHLDGTEWFLCQRGKVSQLKIIEGNPQERSHGEISLCLHTKEKWMKFIGYWRLADIFHSEKSFFFLFS